MNYLICRFLHLMENRAETDEVTKEDIPELLNFLNPVASTCYHLGLQLGVDSGDIKNIREDYRMVKDQLLEILIKRLKQGSLTWAALLKALESKSVGEKRLAKEIRLHFLTPLSPASAQSDKPSVSSFAHHNTPSSSSQSLDSLPFKHHSSVEPPNHQSQKKESPGHRPRSQRRKSPSHRSWRRESSSHRSRSRRRESSSHRSRSRRRESPSHRSRSRRRESPSHRSRSRRRESPSHRSQSQRRESPSRRFRSWRRESPSHRSRSRRRESPSHRSRSRRRESPSHRSRSQRRESPSRRFRSWRRESPRHRSRSRRRESPIHRSWSRRRKSPSHRSRSWRRESPSHRSWRSQFPNHRSQRRDSPNRSSQERSLSSKSLRVESPSSPSQNTWSVKPTTHHSWRRESPIHPWQSTCIQLHPDSLVTQTTGSQSQVNTPTNRSRPHPQPHPQPTQHSVESEVSHHDTPASYSSHKQSTPQQLSTSLDLQLKPLGTLSYTHQHSANQKSSYASQYIHEPLHQSLATAGRTPGLIYNPAQRGYSSEAVIPKKIRSQFLTPLSPVSVAQADIEIGASSLSMSSAPPHSSVSQNPQLQFSLESTSVISLPPETSTPAQLETTTTACPVTAKPAPAGCLTAPDNSSPSILVTAFFEQRVELAATEIEHLKEEFSNIKSETRRSLSERENRDQSFVGTFRDHLLDLPCTKKQVHLKFFVRNEKEILESDTIQKLFIILGRHCNYINYEIILHIVKRFCKDLTQQMLSYRDSLIVFEKATTVDVYLCAILAPPGGRVSAGFMRMTVKINKPASECTLYQIRELKESIEEEAVLESYAMYIETPEPGSVCVRLCIPEEVGWMVGVVLTPDFRQNCLLSEVTVRRYWMIEEMSLTEYLVRNDSYYTL